MTFKKDAPVENMTFALVGVAEFFQGWKEHSAVGHPSQ